MRPKRKRPIFILARVPTGKEGHWIKTNPNQDWFVYFRRHGPEGSAFNGTWKPGEQHKQRRPGTNGQTGCCNNQSAGAVDPGVRSGPPGAGSPVGGLTAAQQAFFTAAQARFAVIETVPAGLGPGFNELSCASCHISPAAGGSSPTTNPQVTDANTDGATNVSRSSPRMVRYGRHASCSIRTGHRMAACTISSRFKGARMRRVASSRSLILPLRSPRTTLFSAYRRRHSATDWWRWFRIPISKALSRAKHNRTRRWVSRVNSISAATRGISRVTGGRRKMPP
jgi:hypothetical protein